MGFFDFFSNDSDSPNGERPLLYERDDALASILKDPTVDIKTKDLAYRVESDMRKLASAGIDPGVAEPRRSLFWDVLDTIDAPRQGVVGIADTLLRGDMFGVDEKTGKDVGLGFRRGQEENVGWSDIFRRHDIIDSPIGRGVAGFALDVLSDPLTYVSFGTLGSAKAGGKALSEAGLALKESSFISTAKRIEDSLIASGIDPISAARQATQDADKLIYEGFGAAGRYADAKKVLKANPSDSVALKRLADAEQQISQVMDVKKVSDDLFAPNKLHFGINLPFLGHLLPEDKMFLANTVKGKDPGIVGQAFKAAATALKPGRIDLGTLDIPEGLVKGFQTINAKAAEGLGKIAAVSESLPIAGPVAKHVNNILRGSRDLFMKTFAESALYGKAFVRERENLFNLRAANHNIANERTIAALGNDLIGNSEAMKDAIYTIDDAARAAGARLEELANVDKQFADKFKLAEGGLSGAAARGELKDGDAILWRDAVRDAEAKGISLEAGFREELGKRLEQAAPETRDAIMRTLGVFDELFTEEQTAGLATNFIENYIPHKYVNRKLGTNSGKATNPSFLKERKYASMADAFKEAGLVADTDLISLVRNRIKSSLDAQAAANFKRRMALEYGLPEHMVFDLYRKAAMGDEAAANILKREHYSPGNLDPEVLVQGALGTARMDAIKAAAEGNKIGEALLAKPLAEFNETIRNEFMSSGRFPLNNDQAQSLFREMGERVEIPNGGGEAVFLPKGIAEGMKDAIASRDLLKEKVQGSPFAKAMFDASEAFINTTKKIVTLPFPAYWAQNLFGDRFRQLSQGMHSYDPRLFEITHSLLSGKTAIKSPGGVVYDTPFIQKLLKENGVNYGPAEHIGVFEAGGKLNPEKLLASQRGLVKNLTSSKGIDKIVAFNQATDFLNRNTDGFFRTTEIVNRLMKGDTPQDAVKAANDLYFNYRNLSPVEQSYFRRFFMFYGYMSKASRAAFTDFVTNPGILTNQMSAVRGLAEMFSDPNAAPTADAFDLRLLTSAVNSEQISHVVGKNDKGRPIIGRGFAAPLNAVLQQFTAYTPRNLSVGELVDTAATSIGRTAQKQFATANPMIRAAAEKLSGKNLYFNKPLDAEFLRKVPSLNAAAEKLVGIPHDQLPLDLDAATKYFLGAEPDGKGRLIAKPGRYWILMNLIPGLSRATSMGGTFTNADVPTKTALLRSILNVNLQDSDVSRTALYDKKTELDKVMRANSVNQRLKNLKDGEE